jgi:hypothetical protein
VWVKVHPPGSLGWTSEQDSITIAIKLLGLRKPKAVQYLQGKQQSFWFFTTFL